MISKIIHYCWFGGKKIPKSVKRCIKSWKKYCPDYKIIKWDENNFDVHQNKFVDKAYKEKKWAFVSDYARYKIIYENGGIYLDTDVELLKSLNQLLNNKCYFPVQQINHNIATGLGFGAEKGNYIVKLLLEQYENLNFDSFNLYSLACPELNKIVFEKIGYKYSENVKVIDGFDVAIYPPKYFDPIAPGDKTENLLCDSTYSIHHYDATWTSTKNILKRKIVKFFGQSRINKLKKFFKK